MTKQRPTYTDLVIANDSDLDSPTVVAALPPERKSELYYLPTRQVACLGQALDALEKRGEQQALVEYCNLFQLWFDQHYPQGHLLSICDYDKDLAIKFYYNNQEKISFLEVYRPTTTTSSSESPLYTIGVDDFAKILEQPEVIDEMGDQLFGELGWQRLKEWITMNS